MTALLERLRALPRITSPAYASEPILAGQEWESYMSVEGRNPAEGVEMQAFMNAFSPGYSGTMRIPILERDGVPRSVAMAMVGQKTEEVYRRYAIVDEAMIREAVAAGFDRVFLTILTPT
jgi:hypothetical protein